MLSHIIRICAYEVNKIAVLTKWMMHIGSDVKSEMALDA